jgi:hypothetical protein
MIQVTRLETIVRRAPLGLRFLDLARGVPVTDGVEVRAWPVAGTGPGHQAIRSPLSGIYGFRSLPGFRLFETGERPASDWCDPAGSSPPGDTEPNFVVAVEDRQQRFLPQALRLCLPRERLMEVPLFSAPARAPLPGLAVIRGELWNRVQARPAGWAMVTASTDDAATYVGLADARGIFTLFVPYASALPPLQGSPPHGSGDVDQLTWPLVIQVFYQPAQQQPVPGLGWPETRSILEQDRAEVYDTPISHGPAITRSLRFGQDLVISTQGLDPPHQSRLLVDPA